MTQSINYAHSYLQVQTAYIQGNYEEAALLVNQLVQDFPYAPNSRLLQGHIFCIQKQYDLAEKQYQLVLNLTNDLELIDCANNGIESVKQYSSSCHSASLAGDNPNVNDNFLNAVYFSESSDVLNTVKQQDPEDLGTLENLDVNSFKFNCFELSQPVCQREGTSRFFISFDDNFQPQYRECY